MVHNLHPGFAEMLGDLLAPVSTRQESREELEPLSGQLGYGLMVKWKEGIAPPPNLNDTFFSFCFDSALE